jgi:hypothetical protein
MCTLISLPISNASLGSVLGYFSRKSLHVMSNNFVELEDMAKLFDLNLLKKQFVPLIAI